MTNADRHRIFLALLEPETLPEDRKELEEICTEEVERIEPIIDDMLEQAERRGRFHAFLEEAERWGNAIENFALTPQPGGGWEIPERFRK